MSQPPTGIITRTKRLTVIQNPLAAAAVWQTMAAQDDLVVIAGVVVVGAILWSSGTIQKIPASISSFLTPTNPTIPSSVGGRTVTTTRGINPMQIMGGNLPATIGAIMGGSGGTIYPALSHASIPDPAGRNQQIHYASSGQAAISHRCDVQFQKPNVEATTFLAWPSGCQGGGHPELAIKFMGPPHTDSSCCYLYSSFVPSGGTLQIGRGAEGPHPNTITLDQVYARIPFQTGKMYGCKGVVWALPGGGAHHESWYNAGSGWQKAGESDVSAWGKNRKASVIANNAQVEFRIDCSNVTYSGTDVAEIRPSTAVAAVGYASYAGSLGTTHRRTKTRQWMEDEE